MAALPSTELMEKETSARKRPRSAEPNDQETWPKHPKGECGSRNQTMRKRRPVESPQIIELTSSSESSPIATATRRLIAGPKSIRKPIQAIPKEAPLFFPSSPPRPVRPTTGSDQFELPFWNEKDDQGSEMDFQLDVSLFEGAGETSFEPGSSGAQRVIGESKHSSTLFPFALGGLDKKGVDDEGGMARGTEPTQEKERGIMVEPLDEDGEMDFENFFSGVEIV